MQKMGWLILAWFIVGLISEVAALVGWYVPWLSAVLLLPLIGLVYYFRNSVIKDKILVFILVLIWLSHLVGVFTPEVGFDAVWYHLPVIKAVAEHHSLVYQPELYQSVNPLFSDLIIGLGYLVWGEFGAKLVAYALGISLVICVYELARSLMSRRWALYGILVVSLFQVVAWQSSSFYVDVAKAFWEMSALWLLLQWHRTGKSNWLAFAGLVMGVSLGTKLFSIVLVPIFLCAVWLLQKNSSDKKIFDKKTFIWQLIQTFIALIIVPLPFYFFAHYHTGSAWFSLGEHVTKLGSIGMSSNFFDHLIMRTKQLPTIFYEFLFARDYTSLVLVLFLPLLIMYFKKMIQHKMLLVLCMWTVVQLMVWWYLPPLSSRYTLSGFITWTIVTLWSVEEFVTQRPRVVTPLQITIALALMINVLPRLAVNYRSLQFLTGNQTKEMYLKQFLDGNIDRQLCEWHDLDC